MVRGFLLPNTTRLAGIRRRTVSNSRVLTSCRYRLEFQALPMGSREGRKTGLHLRMDSVKCPPPSSLGGWGEEKGVDILFFIGRIPASSPRCAGRSLTIWFKQFVWELRRGSRCELNIDREPDTSQISSRARICRPQSDSQTSTEEFDPGSD